MTQNVGFSDRLVRISAGVGLLMTALFVLEGALQVAAVIIGLALIGTGAVGYCGIYSLLGMTTCPVKPKKNEI